MPRKRTTAVIDADHLLRRCESEARDEATRRRVRLIRAVKRSPSKSTNEIAREIGVPPRTAKRWLAVYRDAGLQGLLAIGAHCGPLSTAIESEVARRLRLGEFSSTVEVRHWIRAVHGINVSLPTAARLVSRSVDAVIEREAAIATTDARRLPTIVEGPRIAQWLLDFQTSLPERVDARTWIEALQRSLSVLLDVERVTVAINLHAVESKPLAPSHTISIREIAEGSADTASSVNVTSVERSVPRALQIIREMVARGLNLEDYGEPFSQEFILEDGTYAGTIILWSTIGRGGVSDDAKSLIISMHKVLTRLVLDCAARNASLRPEAGLFYTALQRLLIQYSLTPSEERVAAMRLLGKSYKEIADALHTSVGNVGKHLSAVHRKTGTTSTAELGAVLFSPLSNRRD